MKNYKANKQSGMTLIELAVVLVILVGLAGLLIPYVSSFIGKTHAATSGQTIAALNMAMNRFSNEAFGGGGFPNDLDSLVETTTTTRVGILDSATTQYNSEVISANALTALNNAGISTVMDQQTGTGANYTFGAGTQRTLTAVAGNNLIVLSASGRAFLGQALGINTATSNDAYVVFGVGPSSELNGRTISEAPVHFHAGAADYAARYSRFLAIFSVPSTATQDLATATGGQAKFEGIVGPMNPIEGIGGHIQEYREIVAAENS